MKTMNWMFAGVLALAACDRDQAGQTVTTAADNAVERTAQVTERAADAGARELKREWNDLHIKVNDSPSGTADRNPPPATR